MVDPLKVEAIIQFPSLTRICQLQNLQGKENFLRRFIANYAEITNGFMRLLKKDVLFYWDDQAQISFEALKKYLKTTALLSPPYFNRDFILYLEASDTTIGTILVQEDECRREHPIYYLSRALTNNEM